MSMKKGSIHSNKTRKKLSKAMQNVVKTKKYRDLVATMQARKRRRRLIFS